MKSARQQSFSPAMTPPSSPDRFFASTAARGCERKMQTEFQVRSRRKYEMIDLTREVSDAVRAAGLSEAICSVYVAHATAAIVINENDDPNVCEDVQTALDKLIPEGVWLHD